MKIATNFSLPADLGRGRNPLGTIAAANSERFESANLSQPLTDYAVGWLDSTDLLGHLGFLCPDITVARRFEFRAADNKGAFLSETDDEREVGGVFKKVEARGELVREATRNKGLTIRVDRDETVLADDLTPIVNQLMRRVLMNDLRRAVIALDAAATNANKTWNPAAGTLVNPVADIRDMIRTGGDNAGIDPNRLAFGSTAYDYFFSQVEAFDSNLRSITGLGGLVDRLGIEAARKIDGRFAPKRTAANKTQAVSTKIYSFFGENGIGKDDPSNLKRFVSPTDAGSNVAVYVEEHPKFIDITVEHYSVIVATSTLGVRSLTIANA